VNDGVESFEVRRTNIANIEGQTGHRLRLRPELAFGEQSGIEPDDVVSGGSEEWHQNGSDIAVVSGDKHAHDAPASERVGPPTSLLSAQAEIPKLTRRLPQVAPAARWSDDHPAPLRTGRESLT
jgi:hypothetical protein